MPKTDLQEQVLTAWICLNALLKDSQMTKTMTYNEAVVMNLVFERLRAGEKRTAVQHLLRSANLLKSQMNRTIDALCARGLLKKEREGRSLYVRAVEEKLPDFLAVHRRSLTLVQAIIDLVGEDDAAAFVRICRKLSNSELNLTEME